MFKEGASFLFFRQTKSLALRARLETDLTMLGVDEGNA